MAWRTRYATLALAGRLLRAAGTAHELQRRNESREIRDV